EIIELKFTEMIIIKRKHQAEDRRKILIKRKHQIKVR
ncbi:hypothetical protein U288_02706, partial [Staphylococcus aureus F80358]